MRYLSPMKLLVLYRLQKWPKLKEGENGIGAEKQQLVSGPTLDPMVESLSESDEELEVEDEKKEETTINLSEQEINEDKNK